MKRTKGKRENDETPEEHWQHFEEKTRQIMAVPKKALDALLARERSARVRASAKGKVKRQ